MNFVSLTKSNGLLITVNADKILTVQQTSHNGASSALSYGTIGSQSTYVQENIRDVARKCNFALFPTADGDLIAVNPQNVLEFESKQAGQTVISMQKGSKNLPAIIVLKSMEEVQYSLENPASTLEKTEPIQGVARDFAECTL